MLYVIQYKVKGNNNSDLYYKELFNKIIKASLKGSIGGNQTVDTIEIR